MRHATLIASVILAATALASVALLRRDAAAQPRAGTATFKYHDPKAGSTAVPIASINVFHNPLAGGWFITIVGSQGGPGPSCELSSGDQASALAMADFITKNLGRAIVVDCAYGPPGLHATIPLEDKMKVLAISVPAP